MPTKPLPAKPSLAHLKNQAKDLLRAHEAGDLQAFQRIREFHPRFGASSDARIAAAAFSLSDAHLAIAREYGFSSWPRLKAHVEQPLEDFSLPQHERITDPLFRRAVELLDAGDAAALHAHLAKHPHLVSRRLTFEGGNYFRNPTLLEFVAENPTRRGNMPRNVVEIARLILDAGARGDRAAMNSTLGLVSSSSIARECKVQRELIDLLCSYGANPNEGMLPALLYGEFDAVEQLIRCGAAMSLTAAAATGRASEIPQLLAESSDEDRQRALALAAQHGHFEIVRLLLDAGADPNRYSPVGAHSHATPLHQAVLAGHRDIVRLFVERGARIDMKDIHYNATPLEWARYAKQDEVATYLQECANG